MKNIFVTFIILFVFCNLTQAQTDTAQLTSLVTKLNKQTTTRPVEKVYLHFNKPGYLTGDTIWFKAYLTIGPRHQPSALSGVLYVDMIDGKDKLVKTLKLKAVNGIAAGQIAVSEDQLPGNYRIRAYTNWMRNAGTAYFFTQNITIGDIKTNAVFVATSFDVSGKDQESPVHAQLTYTDKLGRVYDHKAVNYEVKADSVTIFKGTGVTDDKGSLNFSFSDKAAGQKKAVIVTHIKLLANTTVDKTIPINLQNEKADIQFFPEGGQLVAGVRSKVAFKAIGVNGLGISISGVVTDNDHNEVAAFNTSHAGMGVFAVAPQAGRTYTATITLPNNTTTTINLPIANNNGMVLAINNNDSSKIMIRVATNEGTLTQNQNKTYYLVGQSAGAVYYTTALKLDNVNFTATIPKTRLPSGIVQFTLFNANMEPLNERVAFIYNPNDQLNLNLSTAKQVYAAKEKVNIALTANQNKKPVAGSFSMSVYQEDNAAINENEETTILTDLLLTADLQGYIEQPNYYFNNPTQQTAVELDNLMLTQGYRRFSWQDIMADHYSPVIYQPEKTLAISGTVATASGKPVVNGTVRLISTRDNIAIDTLSAANGSFSFAGLDFADSTQLVIQARKANDGKNVNISVDNSLTVPIIYKPNIADASINLLPPGVSSVPSNIQLKNTGIEKADTLQLGKTIRDNTHVKLKEVTIKDKEIAKPDRSNLWGTVMPLAVITGDQLDDFASIASAITNKALGNYYRDGKIYDGLKTNINTKSLPIPIVIDGFIIDENIPIDEAIQAKVIEDIKVMQSVGIKDIYGAQSFPDGKPTPGNKIILVTTKKYAGTDTVKMVKVDHHNQLKDVTIKAKKADKPDQSNLWGAIKPDLVLTGTKMQDYVDIAAALAANVMNVKEINGKIYDINPMVQRLAGERLKAHEITKDDVPIPVILNGVQINPNELETAVFASQIENVKIIQSSAVKSLFGISSLNPNDKVIVITTKAFAGTDTTQLQKVKARTLKEVTIKQRKNAGTEIAPWMPEVTRSANLNGPGHADQVLTSEDIRNCLQLRDCLQAMIPGMVRASGTGDFYFLRHTAQSITHTPPVVFIIDGQLISGTGSLAALDNIIVSNILTIEVLKSTSYLSIYGSNASGGALVITTKLGSQRPIDTTKLSITSYNLKQVNVKSRKNAGTEIAPWMPEVTRSDNLNGPGHADKVLTSADIHDCVLLSQCLQSKIPGLILAPSQDGFYFARHMAQSIKAKPYIVFIVDGQLISGQGSLDILDNINVDNILTIEVLESGSYLSVYGSLASFGALVITTKIGNPQPNDAYAYKDVPGVIYTKFNGFAKARQFYVPKYNYAGANTITDNRTAIYWNPNIITDEKGTLPIEFYNSDVKGTYRAVVEGIDNDGNIGRYVYRYKVE